MLSNGSKTTSENTLRRLGYPSPRDRKDLWAKPRAALGISKAEGECIQVVYWEGFPRAVVAHGIQSETVLAYARGPAFSQPPPVVLVFDDSGNVEAFKREEYQFRVASSAPVWKRTIAEPPGFISSHQAANVIRDIAEGNRNWFQDYRSKRVVGVLPRIFPEGTVILYELLQNAADSGATSAAFRVESDSLLFLHDGNPFTENDVDSISFVNSSMKPLDTIGFMGLGFKAAYEVSDRPEIHSPPFCLYFDHEKEGGELFPISIDCTDHSSFGAYTTLFRFPLKEQARDLIADELNRFDGRPLLYIGGRLRRITTPKGDFQLHRARAVGQAKMLAVSDLVTKSRTVYAVFVRQFEPSLFAWEEFATDRNLEPPQYLGRKQQTSIAITLAGGIPDATYSGRLQVYLPTDVRLPISFDVQGNFIVGASRKELRNASGPWNQEHFRTLPILMADVLDWAKAQSRDDSRWANWYDLVPDWLALERHIGSGTADEDGIAEKIDLTAMFAAELAKRKLIPATNSRGSLVFVGPQEATTVPRGLEEVFPIGDLSALSGTKVLSPVLSDAARAGLAGYLGRFGPAEFKAALEGSSWVGYVKAFSRGTVSKQARRQLAHILAYLERETPNYPGNLSKCTIVLTQDGTLRAAEQHGARKVYTLPDADIAFPPEELADNYEVVHQGFRRELNRPGEMDLEPGITQDAVKALEGVAPTLDPHHIAIDIILPLFRDERWKDVPDDRLLRYTRFLMQHLDGTKVAIQQLGVKVKVRGASRQYLPPKQIYFGREYSIQGERLDQLGASAEGCHFLSDEYLGRAVRSGDNWVGFFTSLGVSARPRIFRSTHHIHESSIDKLRESTGEPGRSSTSLRASPLNGIRGYHYAFDDLSLDPSLLEAIRRLYNVKPPGWKDRLADFATLLEANWAYYQRLLNKRLRYAVLHSSTVLDERVSAPTSFGRFLREEPWLPVVDLHAARRPSELVLNTEENRGLSDKETPLSFCVFKDPDLISFLELQPHPPQNTALVRLRNAVDRQDSDLHVFRALYMELAGDPGLDANALRNEFRMHPLILVPDPDSRYITSGQAVFASRTSLAPPMAAIKDAYPDLEQFFTESLRVSTAEGLSHFVEFLRDYVWKSSPPITDNLRSAVESCYRRFFNYLNETDEDDREKALTSLKEQLASPTVVFCGAQGWVDSTKTAVVYPDMPGYEGFLVDTPGIAIESHLKRLAQPLSEIRPLLDALNVEPISSAIRLTPEIQNHKPHSESDLLGEQLSMLVRNAVAMVERERAQTEPTSRNVALFLREWGQSKVAFEDIRFHHSPLIKVRAELIANATRLVEMQQVAHVSVATDHLDIYVSGDVVEVFDAIADQLRHVLRLDLLPAGLRDEVASLIQSNLARLGHPRFGVYLNRRLQEKGAPVEGDEELQRIVQSAIQDIESESRIGSRGDTEEQVNTPEPERPSSPISGGGGDGGSRPDERQSTPQPNSPTAEGILAQLPSFDDASYGGSNVVDLSGISRWQVLTSKSAPKPKEVGAPGSGGGFRTAQAYRDAYGRRGEQWVLEQERWALINAGRPDLANRVVHRSQTHEGSPWDIESFEKSNPHRPIYIEVKSTTRADNFEVDMSVDQIRTALRSSRPYYLYRVVNVDTSMPTVYIYNFKSISRRIQFSATNVSVTLPQPDNPPQ